MDKIIKYRQLQVQQRQNSWIMFFLTPNFVLERDDFFYFINSFLMRKEINYLPTE